MSLLSASLLDEEFSSNKLSWFTVWFHCDVGGIDWAKKVEDYTYTLPLGVVDEVTYARLLLSPDYQLACAFGDVHD